MKFDLTDIQKDALKEIMSIGAGNATTAISKMTGRRVDVVLPEIDIVSISDIPELMGGPETLAIAVHLDITGDVEGSILLLLDKQSSLHLVDALYGRKTGTTTDLNDEAKSTLSELGNILTGNFMAALSDFMGLHLIHSMPSTGCDMIKALIDSVLIQFAKHADYALVLHVEFNTPPTKIQGHIFMMLNSITLGSILNKIEIKINE